jgi:hypothetical protein
MGASALTLAGWRKNNGAKNAANNTKLFMVTIGFILFHLLS